MAIGGSDERLICKTMEMSIRWRAVCLFVQVSLVYQAEKCINRDFLLLCLDHHPRVLTQFLALLFTSSFG